jgi:transposase-like protein
VFLSGIRKVIYTTNAIENVNAQLRKVIKTEGSTSRLMRRPPS